MSTEPTLGDTPPTPNRHTTNAILLNLLLLAMIAYGYYQSETLHWAWVLVAIPIVVVTFTYVRHWLRGGRE